jgi:hypothetical protein
MPVGAHAPVASAASSGHAEMRRDPALQSQPLEILPQQREAFRGRFDGDHLAIVPGRECQRYREGADMGADVVNQIARFDEAPQQRDFVARMCAELLDLPGCEVSGERRHRTEDALHLDGGRALRSKSIPPMLEPAPHVDLDCYAHGTAADPDNNHFCRRREADRESLRRLDPPGARR